MHQNPLAERVLNAEMDHHLADSTQDKVSEVEKAGNHRNGYSKKTVLTENEALELSIPRDRRGTFEPQLIAKYQRPPPTEAHPRRAMQRSRNVGARRDALHQPPSCCDAPRAER